MGRVMVTVVPCPNVEVISAVPPSALVISSTTARPMPEPRTAFLALKNFIFTFCRSSGAMPRPWSRMLAVTVVAVRVRVKKMVPSGGEYLMALSNTLTNT